MNTRQNKKRKQSNEISSPKYKKIKLSDIAFASYGVTDYFSASNDEFDTHSLASIEPITDEFTVIKHKLEIFRYFLNIPHHKSYEYILDIMLQEFIFSNPK